METKTIEFTQIELKHMALLGFSWLNAAKETGEQEEIKLANDFCSKLLANMDDSGESKMLEEILMETRDKKIIL